MLIKNQGRKTLQALYSLVPNYILFIKIKFLAIMFKIKFCCLLFCFLERIYFNAPIPRHLQTWDSKLKTIPGSQSFFSWHMIFLSLNFKNVIPDIDIYYTDLPWNIHPWLLIFFMNIHSVSKQKNQYDTPDLYLAIITFHCIRGCSHCMWYLVRKLVNINTTYCAK